MWACAAGRQKFVTAMMAFIEAFECLEINKLYVNFLGTCLDISKTFFYTTPHDTWNSIEKQHQPRLHEVSSTEINCVCPNPPVFMEILLCLPSKYTKH